MQDFPLNAILHESNILFHPFLQHFYTLLEGFSWDASQPRRSLDDPLAFGEKEKCFTE